MQSKTHCIVLVISWMLFTAASAATCQQDSYRLRTWTDSSGKFEVEAKFREIKDGKAVLEKKDGSILRVAVELLSNKDRDFLKSLKSKPQTKPEETSKSLRQVKAAERGLLFAEKIAEEYEKFLTQELLSSGDRHQAKERLKELEPHVKSNSVLVGRSFKTPEEIRIAEQRSDKLIEECLSLVQSKLYEDAEKKMKEASIVDEVHFRADFISGIIYACGSHDYDKAEKHFLECVRRGRRYRPILGMFGETNLVGALNNLALIKVRQNQLSRAYALWAEAIQIRTKPSREIKHNLQRVLKYIAVSSSSKGINYVKTSSMTERKYEDLYKRIILADSGSKATVGGTGWHYTGFVIKPKTNKESQPAAGNQSKGQAESQYIVVGSGSGMVVHPGYVLTNRHVVEEGGYLLPGFWLTLGASKTKYFGKTIAISEKHDLAIIKCEAIKNQGVSFRESPIGLAEEVLVAGYPSMKSFGAPLTTTKGVVSALPHSKNSQIMFDAIANPGNSGGPVFDDKGNVMAVLTTGYQFSQKMTGGVSSSDALPFLKKHIPGFSNVVKDVELKTAEAVAKNKADIAQIHCLIQNLGDAVAISGNDNAPPSLAVSVFIDKACLICDGKSKVKCRNRDCSQGAITEWRSKSELLPNGKVQVTRFRVKVKCPVCNGTNAISCNGCSNGSERIGR